MPMVNLKIDNINIQVEPGTTILQAARQAGIVIPTLCAWTEINHTPGACRVCIVEVEGQRNPVASCAFAVAPGMKVEAALDYPVLVQGSAPRSTLLKQFRSTPHAILLATIHLALRHVPGALTVDSLVRTIEFAAAAQRQFRCRHPYLR